MTEADAAGGDGHSVNASARCLPTTESGDTMSASATRVPGARLRVRINAVRRGAVVAAACSTMLLLAHDGAAQRVGETAPSRRAMALTFDDLPYAQVGEVDTSTKAERVTRAIVRVLRSHEAPAVGFVNEAKLRTVGRLEDGVALLEQWIGSGATLGNHTSSHADLNTVSVERFQDEIISGEMVTRRLMEPHQPYQAYFRHPYTHTGDTQAKKEAVEDFLAARGYRIAPHTVDSSAFIFNRAYVKSRGRDEDQTQRLRNAYLDFVVEATDFAEQIARRVFGREIPQTILLHANDINADALDELLQRLTTRGYRFVTLDEVMSDAAYRTRDTFVTRFGPTWLWRWVKSKGLDVDFSEDPEPQEWVTRLTDEGAPDNE